MLERATVRSMPSGEVSTIRPAAAAITGRGRRRSWGGTTSASGRIAHSLAPLLAMFSAAHLDSFESATALPGPADHRDRLQVASSKAYGSSKRKGRRKSIARVAAPAARSGSNSWPAPS